MMPTKFATGKRPGHSIVVRVLLLAAFLVQCTFVQTHVHAAPLAAPAGIAALDPAGPAEAPAHGPDGASSYCFLCWEAAVAGQFVLPTMDSFAALPQPDGWIAAQAATSFALGKFSHGWLSRAPPQ